MTNLDSARNRAIGFSLDVSSTNRNQSFGSRIRQSDPRPFASGSIRERWRPGCARCSTRRFLRRTGALSEETETKVLSTGRPGIVFGYSVIRQIRTVQADVLIPPSVKTATICLLVSQRHHRIDFRRATSRDITSQQRNRGKQQRNQDKRQRVRSCYAVQQARHHLPKRTRLYLGRRLASAPPLQPRSTKQAAVSTHHWPLDALRSALTRAGAARFVDAIRAQR